MLKKEVAERYQIPTAVLKQYERWVRKGAKDEYGDDDIARLSFMVTLYSVGFSAKEIETYLRLEVSEDTTGAQRLAMLERRRAGCLREIHRWEEILDKLDYLRHQIKQHRNGEEGSVIK